MNTIIYVLLAFFVSPFTGAMLRDWQGCCFEFSATLAVCLLPLLALGLSVRFIPWFAKRLLLQRVVSWGGLSLWCVGAPISCIHAFS